MRKYYNDFENVRRGGGRFYANYERGRLLNIPMRCVRCYRELDDYSEYSVGTRNLKMTMRGEIQTSISFFLCEYCKNVRGREKKKLIKYDKHLKLFFSNKDFQEEFDLLNSGNTPDGYELDNMDRPLYDVINPDDCERYQS